VPSGRFSKPDGIGTVHLMVSGMAHVSGAVMAAYVFLRARRDSASADGGDHDCARHHHAGQDILAGVGKPVTAGRST